MMWELTGGTVQGCSHQINQDAYFLTHADDGSWSIGAVADGCGSTPHSEYGSRFLARSAVDAVYKEMDSPPEMSEINPRSFVDRCWEIVSKRLHQHFQQLGGQLSESEQIQLVHSHLLATVHLLVVTPQWTLTCGSGDGVVWYNDTVHSLTAPKPDMPAYPAYTLLPSHASMDIDVSFDLHFHAATDELEFAGIATDGLDEFLAKTDAPLRGEDTVGPIDQFQDPSYYDNTSLVTRRLRAIGQVNGHLHDDTTLVAMRHDTTEA